MRVTVSTRRALDIRREERRLKGLGYRKHETDWEIHRGHRTGEVIQDVKISMDGSILLCWRYPAHCSCWCHGGGSLCNRG